MLRKQIREMKRRIYKGIKENLMKNCSEAVLRRWEEKSTPGSGLWLQTLPNKNKPLHRIPKHDFHDALQLWLNLTPQNLPRLCQVKECNSEFSIEHADHCAKGSTMIRIENFFAVKIYVKRLMEVKFLKGIAWTFST